MYILICICMYIYIYIYIYIHTHILSAGGWGRCDGGGLGVAVEDIVCVLEARGDDDAVQRLQEDDRLRARWL